jgi:hypothetical protein
MKLEDVKVGQRVRYMGGPEFLEGCVGTCTYISPVGQIAIEFDKSYASLHTCNGYCKKDHGWWGKSSFLTPVEEEVVDNSIPCAPPPPVDVTANNRGMSNNQVDRQVERLADVVSAFFIMGASRQDMLELFNDINKKYFSEKQLRDKIATIKDKVTKCQN